MAQTIETRRDVTDVKRGVRTLIERSASTGAWFRQYLYPGDTSLTPLLAYITDPYVTPQVHLRGMDLKASRRISKQIIDSLGERANYYTAAHTTLDAFWRIGADAATLARPDFETLPYPNRLRVRIITRIHQSEKEFDKKLHTFLEQSLGQAFDLRINKTAQTFTITDAHLNGEAVLNKWANVKQVLQTL